MLILRGEQGAFMGVSQVRVFRHHTSTFSSCIDEKVFLCPESR